MKHLNVDTEDFLDALCGETGRVQQSFEDLLADLEEQLETGELTVNEVIHILEQYS